MGGDRMGQPWLKNADTVAALGVAAIVVGVSVRWARNRWTTCWTAFPSICKSGWPKRRPRWPASCK